MVERRAVVVRLRAIDLQPAALKAFILANREALMVEAGSLADR
jgi:hypothetical protein